MKTPGESGRARDSEAWKTQLRNNASSARVPSCHRLFENIPADNAMSATAHSGVVPARARALALGMGLPVCMSGGGIGQERWWLSYSESEQECAGLDRL